MKTISSALIIEKNKLSSAQPWLILLDITVDESTTLYLVKNNENVTYAGNEYQAFPFEIEPVSYKSKGEMPTIQLQVSNVTRALQTYLEAASGLVGQTVTVRVVNANLLTEDYTELTEEFFILASTADTYWVTLTLGGPSPAGSRFPLYRYFANHCAYVEFFKGAECKYAGEDASCTGTLADCKTKSNSVNFGGFPGLARGGVKLA